MHVPPHTHTHTQGKERQTEALSSKWSLFLWLFAETDSPIEKIGKVEQLLKEEPRSEFVGGGPTKIFINTPKIPPSIFLDKVNTPKTDDPFFRIQGRTGTARLPPDRHAAAADEPQHGQAIRERVHTARYRLPSIRFHTYTRIFSLFFYFSVSHKDFTLQHN